MERLTKKCSSCGENKTYEEYHKNKSKRTGRVNACRSCINALSAKRKAENPEKFKERRAKYYQEKGRKQKDEYYEKNKEKIKRQKAEYYEENSEELKATRKKRYAENPEKSKAQNARWRSKNPNYSAEYNAAKGKVNYAKWKSGKGATYKKRRLARDVNYRLQNALRGRLYKALKSDQKVGSAVVDLGCSIQELKQYLEGLFQPSMSWENWALDGWHIDHIVPLAAFDLTDRDQFLKACHYTNLQPLWAADNLSKSDKLSNVS